MDVVFGVVGIVVVEDMSNVANIFEAMLAEGYGFDTMMRSLGLRSGQSFNAAVLAYMQEHRLAIRLVCDSSWDSKDALRGYSIKAKECHEASLFLQCAWRPQ